MYHTLPKIEYGLAASAKMRLQTKYAYARVLIGRGNAHLSVPSMFFANISIAALLVKSFGISNWWVAVFSVTLIGGTIAIGYIDLKTRFLEIENTVNNSYNKEILQAAGKVKQ